MDNNKLVGRTFGQKTTATKDEQGYWKLRVVIEETVTYPDGTKKEETIESECVDKDFDTAHRIALYSALRELGYLVYDRKFDSLIEGREYEREHYGNSQDNTDTTTQ